MIPESQPCVLSYGMHTLQAVCLSSKFFRMKPAKLLIVFVFWAAYASAGDLKRPNIILMMADDMGIGDTSAYQDFTGNSDAEQIHTPAMERLARMGVRFTDAHTPSSRCSPTRYGLLTGRYPWRNRLKHWVLFGAQGDPTIEADRPTIATLLRDNGYRTGMVGKWHVGLRYRNQDGQPAAGFEDADLNQPLLDTPLDHGFQYCRFTSRSHKTSGPEPGKKNTPQQNVGPGHIHGRTAIGATNNGRQLASDGPTAFVLSELGSRHSNHAIEFLTQHVASVQSQTDPFFLYYASNSNHSPYTPDADVGGLPVKDAGRNVDGSLSGNRGDFIYENDVALGRLLNWLESTDDPRSSGRKLINNTIVIFTSDNGAEVKTKSATGPFRSNKGSCYEGGHRVPFIAAWPAGGVGDGSQATPGKSSAQLLCLTDMFATFADILNVDLPDNANGLKGAEDSFSMLGPLQSDVAFGRPVFFNDHNEAPDHAVVVLRFDDPVVAGETFAGQWKLFFDAQLLRLGHANPMELYDLRSDSREANNRISDTELQPLVDHLSELALLHRTAGGHRLADAASADCIVFDWTDSKAESRIALADSFVGDAAAGRSVTAGEITMTVTGICRQQDTDAGEFSVNNRGLGLSGAEFEQVDSGEALLFRFDKDVIVESAAIIAGNGVCGGYYQVGDQSTQPIYCVDADIDSNNQSGVLSDIGVVKAGQTLRLDSTPHYASEAKGRWRLQQLTIRLLK